MGADNSRYDAGYDLPLPAAPELRAIADDLGFSVDEGVFEEFVSRARDSVLALRSLRDLPQATPPTRYPRLPGGLPDPAENPYNGWSWRCEVTGADDGALHAVTVAVKESVCVAGVPMSNGSAFLEGHAPAYDATVVTRLLDAGACVVGRATTEGLGLSSGSNTAVSSAVVNPRRPGHSVGGSSSGCAAVVAAGDCDLAIGTDQGGSVRIPAALTGLFGLKPTFGLVPYTGVLSIETSLDHVGFLARSIDLISEALAATAGTDGMDPRQSGATEVTSPRPDRLRIAVLREGVEAVGAADVIDRIGQVAATLRGRGVEVEEVSVPEHALSAVTSIPVYAQGITTQLQAGGTSLGWKGWYADTETATFGAAVRAAPNRLPDTGKLFAILGTYLRNAHGPRYYARAQNAALALRACYDRALRGYDALLMPTCAPEPVALPLPEAPDARDVFDAGFGYHLNTAIFNLTGHPAVSVPAGEVRGLPFGAMLVGRNGEDQQLLATADVVASATE
jgi:amidase